MGLLKEYEITKEMQYYYCLFIVQPKIPFICTVQSHGEVPFIRYKYLQWDKQSL